MASDATFIHPSKRYRLYFDETGNGDLHATKKDQHQRYLSLTGLVIRQDTHDSTTTSQLTNLKSDVFGKDNRHVVLHRRDIIGRKGVFEVLKDDALRAKFDCGFVEVVSAPPTPIFTVSIDKQKHLEKYKVWQFSPYHYALTCLLERYVLWLYYSGNRGDVMGEARGPKHDSQLRRSFRFFYKNGTKVKTSAIQKCLISHELRLELKEANVAALQIADLLAHPAHRAYKFDKLGLPQPIDYGASLVRILEKKKYHRSKLGRIEGYPKRTRGPIGPGDRKRSPFDRSRIDCNIRHFIQRINGL